MLDWLTEDQRALRDMAITFARKEVEPLAIQIDMDEHTPDSLTQAAAEFGLFGLYTSPEYGGAGADLVSVCLVSRRDRQGQPGLCRRADRADGAVPEDRRNPRHRRAESSASCRRSASGERLIAYSQSEPSGAANVVDAPDAPDAGRRWLPARRRQAVLHAGVRQDLSGHVQNPQ